MDTPLHLAPIDDIVTRHISGDVSIEETVASCTQRIDEVNDLYNAVVWSDPVFIKSEIDRAHSQRESGGDFPLLGVPILVKEIDSAIEGTPNSWGNYRLKEMGYCDDYTSTSVTLLRDAGAIIVGKTNNPELALAIMTEQKAHGVCNNPLDVTRNTGGSSGGAAAAVASGMVSVATSSDGGGSSRVPASCCGVFGFKPSRGRIPLGPLFEDAWDGLVCKGLISSNMDDLTRVLDVMASQNFHDTLTSVPQSLRIGIRTEGFGSDYSINPYVISAVDKAAGYLTTQGHHVAYTHPSSYDDSSIVKYFMDILSYNTALDFRILEQITNNTIDISACEELTQFFYYQGLEMSESDHNNAVAKMLPFAQTIDGWFGDFDVLITPTSGDVAPAHGEVSKNPELAWLYSGLCFPSNIAGLPSISVPITTDHPAGLPIGLQIIAARGNDELALQLAHALETDYSDIFVTRINNITS